MHLQDKNVGPALFWRPSRALKHFEHADFIGCERIAVDYLTAETAKRDHAFVVCYEWADLQSPMIRAIPSGFPMAASKGVPPPK